MNVKGLKWALEELADESLQEKLWLGKLEGQMGSFIEAVCGVFDDSGLGHALESKSRREFLTNEIVTNAEELQRLIRAIPNPGDPTAVLRHPNMDLIRAQAAKLLLLVQQ